MPFQPNHLRCLILIGTHNDFWSQYTALNKPAAVLFTVYSFLILIPYAIIEFTKMDRTLLGRLSRTFEYWLLLVTVWSIVIPIRIDITVNAESWSTVLYHWIFGIVALYASFWALCSDCVRPEHRSRRFIFLVLIWIFTMIDFIQILFGVDHTSEFQIRTYKSTVLQTFVRPAEAEWIIYVGKYIIQARAFPGRLMILKSAIIMDTEAVSSLPRVGGGKELKKIKNKVEVDGQSSSAGSDSAEHSALKKDEAKDVEIVHVDANSASDDDDSDPGDPGAGDADDSVKAGDKKDNDNNNSDHTDSDSESDHPLNKV